MGKDIQLLKKRREAYRELLRAFEAAEHSLIIHYSCEDFTNRPDGSTPRITSIAVRHLKSGQTESFSIHKTAEQRQTPYKSIAQNYDSLEKAMLDDFFDFVIAHQSHVWIHWNMRDINYGFAAVEHRYKVLGGNPTKVSDEKKIDLARSLVAIYGIRYMKHPRLQNLVRANDISGLASMTGEEEAAAFAKGDYVLLHKSTLRKVDILANLFERAVSRTLKTNAKWYNSGQNVVFSLTELIKTHPIYSLIGIVVAGISFIATIAAVWHYLVSWRGLGT